MMVKRDDLEGVENSEPQKDQNPNNLLNQIGLDKISGEIRLATDNLSRIELLPYSHDKIFMIEDLQHLLIDLRVELQLAVNSLVGKIAEVDHILENTDDTITRIKKEEFKPVINQKFEDLKQFGMYLAIFSEYGILSTDEFFEILNNDDDVYNELFSKLKRSDTGYLVSEMTKLNYIFPN